MMTLELIVFFNVSYPIYAMLCRMYFQFELVQLQVRNMVQNHLDYALRTFDNVRFENLQLLLIQQISYCRFWSMPVLHIQEVCS